MRTTLLNPAIWLLAATIVSAVAGAISGLDARASFSRVVRIATIWPVLCLLLLASFGAVASRIVLGYLSPGAYAEEVLAARTFIEHRRLYAADPADQAAWLADSTSPALPWGDVPGITPCQANALSNRGRFYTEHAHPPTLLLLGVPIVRVMEGAGLYVVFTLAGLAAVAALAVILARRASLDWRSRSALLILAAVAGWQPVVAGLRQGDAVLPAAALAAVAWRLLASGRPLSSVPAALAGVIAVAAVTTPLALLRRAPRAGLLALTILALAVAGTMALAGADVIPAFARTVAESAATYARATPNYALSGLMLVTGGRWLVAAAIAVVVLCSWRYAKTDDAAFALFGAAGLLVAPLVWSQHLVLMLIPVTVLLERVLGGGSSLGLAALAVLVAMLSLPDPVIVRAGQLCQAAAGSAIPFTALSILAIWGWVAIGDRRVAIS